MGFPRKSDVVPVAAYQQNYTVVKVYTRGSGCSSCLVLILLAIAALVILAVASGPPR